MGGVGTMLSGKVDGLYLIMSQDISGHKNVSGPKFPFY